jgi:hypothetical protein
MCFGGKCPVKGECHRHTAPVSEWQAMGSYPASSTGEECDDFCSNEGRSTMRKAYSQAIELIASLRRWRPCRRLRGGLWIQHDDRGWVRGKWVGNAGNMIYDEDGLYYRKTSLSVLKIEDYTKAKP